MKEIQNKMASFIGKMKVKIKFKGEINYKAIKMRCPNADIEFIKHLNGEWTAKVSEHYLEQVLPILSEDADYYKILL